VGDKDSSGRKIKFIHAKVLGKYIIYETTERQVLIAGDSVSLANNSRLNKLLTQIADLTTHTPSLKEKYNSSSAHAMKIFLDGDADASHELLRDVYKDMTRYLMRRAKVAYQAGAALLMLLSLIVFLIAYRLGISNQLVARLFYATVFSSMGGFLSVALSAGKLKIDLQNNLGINALYGSLRILMAMISGVIVYFLIEERIVLAFLKDTSDINGFIIASFISGFSEKLIPNLMNHIEAKSD
jgi:hypothetical protein